MKAFLYFNGWNSAITQEWHKIPKLQKMNRWCKKNDYRFMPCHINWKKPTQCLRDILEHTEEFDTIIFCGTSLGGWFSRIIQIKAQEQWPEKKVHAIALNPSLNPGTRLMEVRGWVTNYVTGEEYAWTYIDCEELQEIEDSVDYLGKHPGIFMVALDEADELINYRDSYKLFEPCLGVHDKGLNMFCQFPGGTHRFEHTAEVLELLPVFLEKF